MSEHPPVSPESLGLCVHGNGSGTCDLCRPESHEAPPAVFRLEEFDQEYFQELEGQDGWKAIGQENCMNQSYFTVCDESGEKLGIVGLYDTDDEKNITHIVIDPKHRGKGMLPKFYEALTGSTGADYLVATIDRNNTASIRSHEKAGFRKTSDDKYEEEFDKFRYQYDVPEED